jgi:hypothetical protein
MRPSAELVKQNMPTKCVNCIYFDESDYHNTRNDNRYKEDRFGHCRRHAPRVTRYQCADSWPVVKGITDYCGDGIRSDSYY